MATKDQLISQAKEIAESKGLTLTPGFEAGNHKSLTAYVNELINVEPAEGSPAALVAAENAAKKVEEEAAKKVADEAAEKAADKEKEVFPYTVAKGKGLSTLKGIKGAGEEMKAEYLQGGQATLDKLVRKGYVDEA